MVDHSVAPRYPVILADPPWHFANWGRDVGKRSAASHYPTMPTEAIAALPIRDLAADDCVLFLWVTWPHLYEAKRVIDGWGFTYRTLAFDWIKVRRGLTLHWGMGYWTRSNSEPCLLCTRGNPKRKARDVHQAIWSWEDHAPEALIAKVQTHSQKPDEQYGRIERLVDGPYLELFARRSHDGWDAFGNQVAQSITIPGVASSPARPQPINAELF